MKNTGTRKLLGSTATRVKMTWSFAKDALSRIVLASIASRHCSLL